MKRLLYPFVLLILFASSKAQNADAYYQQASALLVKADNLTFWSGWTNSGERKEYARKVIAYADSVKMFGAIPAANENQKKLQAAIADFGDAMAAKGEAELAATATYIEDYAKMNKKYTSARKSARKASGNAAKALKDYTSKNGITPDSNTQIYIEEAIKNQNING